MITVSPIGRVEGDLEVKVEIDKGQVNNAFASGVIYRGFEKLLRGRDPIDALVLTCRVCGICSITHSIASSNALRDAFKAQMPPNAYLLKNIALASETMMSHLTHFYLSFTTDLTNAKYTSHKAYDEIKRRFSPFTGTSYRRAFQLRRNILEIVGLIAGKWPNTLAFHPGGTTKPLNAGEIIRAKAVLLGFQNRIEETLLGCSVDRWLGNRTLAQLMEWLGEAKHAQGDLGFFMRCALDAGLDQLGRGPGRFFSCGGYDLPEGKSWLRSGYFAAEFEPFDQEKIAEHIKYSWLDGYDGGQHPFDQAVEPNADKAQAYSWAKAPRYQGKTAELGALARMIIDRDPLALSLFQEMGPNVLTRCVARIHECIRLLKQIAAWLGQVDPEQPFFLKHQNVGEAQGIGLTEAARGTLGHWISIEHNRIKNYQIITPSTWNLSPRDSSGNPGPLEEALIGTPVQDDKNPIEVAHVIRSFDPCLFCTVHAVRDDGSLASFSLQG